MKIKRFVAKDMRTALTEVKEFLGPDAIILSNKKVAGGVEIVAAVDPEAAPVKASAPKSEPASPARVAESRLNIKVGDDEETGAEPADSLRELLARQMLKQQKAALETETAPTLKKTAATASASVLTKPLLMLALILPCWRKIAL